LIISNRYGGILTDFHSKLLPAQVESFFAYLVRFLIEWIA
jgi:hypothetical protein